MPVPATVYPDPLPARVTDGTGAPVTVTGRALPLRVPRRGCRPAAGRGWRSPPGPAPGRLPNGGGGRRPRARRARFQLVTEDGTAWLAAVQDGRWQIEARYD